MATQNTLKVGDLITIAKVKGTHMVIRSEHRISPAYDGVPYTVDEFDTIERTHLELRGRVEDPKVKSWYLEGGSMRGAGKMVKDSDIKVIGTCKVQVETTVAYLWGASKLYGNR